MVPCIYASFSLTVSRFSIFGFQHLTIMCLVVYLSCLEFSELLRFIHKLEIVIKFGKFLAIISSNIFFQLQSHASLSGTPITLMFGHFLLFHWSPRLCSVFFSLFSSVSTDKFLSIILPVHYFFLCHLHLHQTYSMTFSFQLLFSHRISIWLLFIVSIYLWNSLSVLSLRPYTPFILLIYFPLTLYAFFKLF